MGPAQARGGGSPTSPPRVHTMCGSRQEDSAEDLAVQSKRGPWERKGSWPSETVTMDTPVLSS